MYTMKNLTCLIGVFLSVISFNVTAQTANIPDFPWMKEVGAKTFPVQQTVYNVTDYGAKGDALERIPLLFRKQLTLLSRQEEVLLLLVREFI